MSKQQPLKRKMLSNPSTGGHRGHPKPHPSQLTDKRPSRQTSTPSTIDISMQDQLNSAVSQLDSKKQIKAHAKPKSKPKQESLTETTPKKPKKPVVVPPKPKKQVQSSKLAKDITKDIASKIAEVPKSHIPSNEEIERIKKLNSYKPIIIGTTLFILGLVVSAIIAIVLELI